MADPIQSNTDVPGNMVHMRSCKCSAARFTEIVSEFSSPIVSDEHAGSGCMVHCMLCSMMADFQGPLGDNAGNAQ